MVCAKVRKAKKAKRKKKKKALVKLLEKFRVASANSVFRRGAKQSD